MTPTDAQTRLRYVADVRRRTRHAAVTPVLFVGVLGALIVVRGLLTLYWPNVAGVSAAWFLGTSLVGIAAAIWLEQRQRQQSGVVAAARGRPVVFVVMVAAELLAHAIGANVLIAGIGVALTAVAWRIDMRAMAIVVAVIGAISEGLVLDGTRQWAALVIFGAGLVAVGIMGRRTSRRTP